MTKSAFPLVAAALGALLVGGSAQAAGWTLGINTALTTDDPMYKGLEKLQQSVEAKTKGEIKIRLFSGSQLGKDEDVLEQARAGANVAVLVDGGRLAEFAPELGIMAAPYLVDSFEDVRKVVTSDLFESWVEKLRKASHHQILSFNWYQGKRHLLTNKPVRVPADLSGVRMRTPGAPVWMETIRAMGATPTPMGWTEVYTALQQGVIDAAEAQLPAVYGSRLYEVVSHITKTGHFFLITGLVTSADWFDTLTPEYRKLLRDEALAAGDYASKLTMDSLADYQKKMVAGGVTVDEIDTTPFKEATKVVYDKLGLANLRAQVDAVLSR